MLDSVINLLLATVVGVACFGAGRAVLRGVGLSFQSLSEEVVLDTGVGFGILIYVMALLGVGGAYRPASAWSLLAVLGVLSVWGLWTWPWRSTGAALVRGVTFVTGAWPLAILLVVLLVYWIVYLLAALAPTLDGDSIAGYLLTAREYSRQGGIVGVDYAYTDSLPANGQMLSTMGFLLRGQILAQLLVVWSTGLLTVFAIYAFGRVWLSRRVALMAIVIWYGTASVGFLAASGKIDLTWAVFDLLALLAFSRWYFVPPSDRSWRWLALSGFLLGVAGGTKQATLFTAIVLAGAIVVRLIQDHRGSPRYWLGAYLALGLPAVVAGAWVARSFVMTGDLAATGSALRGETGVVGFFSTLWQMSMLGNAESTDGPLGKSIGPTIIATIPLLVLIRGVDRRIWHILAFSAIMLVLWYLGVQRARHLLPTLALLSLAASYAVTMLLARRPRLGQAVVGLASIALLLNLGTWTYVNLVSSQRVPYVLGMQDLDGYLATNLPKWRMYPNHTMVAYSRDHLPANARIAGASTSNSYYLERPLYTNWTLTPREVPDPEDFAERMRSSGITHVFINDFVVERRGYQDAWLLQPSFQSTYLTGLVCAGEQCLYSLSGAQPGKVAEESG